MGKSKKKKPLSPRVKRMNRPARLESAKKWIPTYTGKHLLRGYCNHFAVDWRCAVIELKLLGVGIDPAYIANRERTEVELTKQRQTRKEERKSLHNLHWHPFTDAYSAFLAGDFAAMHELQMQDEYGDQWEDHTQKEHTCGNGDTDNEHQCDIRPAQFVGEPSVESDDWIPF